MCGWSRSATQEELLRSGKLKLHAKPEPSEGAELIALLAKHGLTLPRNAIEWRDGKGVLGTHTALGFQVRLLCTDGVCAWFLLGDDVTTLFGHLSNFEAVDTDKPYCGPRKRSTSRKPKTSSATSQAVSLLAQMLQTLKHNETL